MAGDSHSNSTHQQQAMLMYKSYRIPSDMDSQISLPRSYTLPREFKYYRRPKSRKAIRSEHFVASTNSSDGRLSHDFQNPSTYKKLMLVMLLLHMLVVRVGSSYEQEQEMATTYGMGSYSCVSLPLLRKVRNVSLDSCITWCILLFCQV